MMDTMVNTTVNTLVLPQLSELEFEDNTHTYRLDGLIIPSVSAIMEPLSAAKYSGIREDTLNRAADKGTSVHNAIENWIKFGIEDIQSEFRGYFDGFPEWWEKNQPIVVGSEVRVYHKLMRYGGTIDLLAYIGDELTLVDYKSTYALSEMTCGVQLEAYWQALASQGVKVQRKKILHLKKDGKYSERDFQIPDAARWRTFGSLKCVYDYIESYR